MSHFFRKIGLNTLFFNDLPPSPTIPVSRLKKKQDAMLFSPQNRKIHLQNGTIHYPQRAYFVRYTVIFFSERCCWHPKIAFFSSF